jgi:hypothetical protein
VSLRQPVVDRALRARCQKCRRSRDSISIVRRSDRSTLKQTKVRNDVMLYRGFPSKLHHAVPDWVEPGALFHIRVALDRETQQQQLTESALAQRLLDSAHFYESRQCWHITLFLLMPDHLHALLSFARRQSMSHVIGNWKHFHARKHGIVWQEVISIIACATMNTANNSRQR